MEEFHYSAADGTSVYARRWVTLPSSPRAVVQIVHGAGEHSGRYDRFARFLNANGYVVYANDHRGHGQTRVRSKALGDAGPDAWNRFVDDVHELNMRVRREMPKLPTILFGHSMGSFIAQDYLARHGNDVRGVVYCATNGWVQLPDEAIARLNDFAAKDPFTPSLIFINNFTKHNHAWTPGKPGRDWLSRDPAEVQAYNDDPLCGFVFNNELTRDFYIGLHNIFLPERESRIPRDKPILVIAGDQDPVGRNTQGITPLLERYRGYGVQTLTVKFYPGARHELLNETNRDEVQADILAWLNAII